MKHNQVKKTVYAGGSWTTVNWRSDDFRANRRLADQCSVAPQRAVFLRKPSFTLDGPHHKIPTRGQILLIQFDGEKAFSFRRTSPPDLLSPECRGSAPGLAIGAPTQIPSALAVYLQNEPSQTLREIDDTR